MTAGIEHTPIKQQITDLHWRSLQLLGSFRLIIAVAFGASLLLFNEPKPFGGELPALFNTLSVGYLIFALLSAYALSQRKPRFEEQVMVQVASDIAVITLTMHASGGISSGLGILLILPVGAAGMITGTRQALGLAAFATLCILIEATMSRGLSDYTQAGLLGAALLGTASVAALFARRLGLSLKLARQRETDLARLTALNEIIIRHMDAGLIVTDDEGQVRLMNNAAWQMLDMPAGGQDQPLEAVSDKLARQWHQWHEDPSQTPQTIRLSNQRSLYPRFTPLGLESRPGSLILLEDRTQLEQQSQNQKLAALGRLTASIAHEIRNPLGAISHASQLLHESDNLDEADRRLSRIISEQSLRMNTIIENIMQLGRRDNIQSETFALEPWLKDFVREFANTHHLEIARIQISVAPRSSQVTMDMTHLHQVLTNLVENALSHGTPDEGEGQVEIHGGINEESKTPFIEVSDTGRGIEPQLASQIFEPFFTTRNQGTGLGLYIARELCEVNGCELKYVPIPTGGSCFRIQFPKTK